ncbi:MAG: hypothetical protein ACM3YE_06280 [Bacteroidota bacterium]
MDQSKSRGGSNDFSLVLRTDGAVWAWGNNYHGELGNEHQGIFTSPNQGSRS